MRKEGRAGCISSPRQGSPGRGLTISVPSHPDVLNLVEGTVHVGTKEMLASNLVQWCEPASGF